MPNQTNAELTQRDFNRAYSFTTNRCSFMWKLLTDENDKKTKNKKKTKKDIKQAPYVVMSGIGQGAMQQAKGQSIEKGRSREGGTEECWSSSQIRLI